MIFPIFSISKYIFLADHFERVEENVEIKCSIKEIIKETWKIRKFLNFVIQVILSYTIFRLLYVW